MDYLQSLIDNASAQILEYKAEQKELRSELVECGKLKPILEKIGNDSLDTYTLLNDAGESLNSGIIIDGVGQGERILERATKINDLYNKASIAANAVEKRITKLENDIDNLTNEIAKLDMKISGWREEISRIQAAELAAQQALQAISNPVKTVTTIVNSIANRNNNN